MIQLQEALDLILAQLKPLPAESLPLASAVGRVAAERLLAPADLPPFDNSAVDGYALRSEDTLAASPGSPCALECIGVLAAGDTPKRPLPPGTCLRIFTGAVIPPGADAVVMQEDVTVEGEARIQITTPLTPMESVRPAGEDVRMGTPVLVPGQILSPGRIGLLAACGFGEVTVHRRPRLALLTSGSELTSPGESLAPGRIYDSNSALLAALAAQAGFPVTFTARIPDTPELTMARLLEAARASDAIVTTGGVSVGDADFLRPAMAALGGQVDLWRVALKPGKPFAFGQLEGARWFGLPGNPVSAFVTWQVLALPALRRLAGHRNVEPRSQPATLAEPMVNRGDRRSFLRVKLDAAGNVSLAGRQGSHIQSSLADADALLEVPPEVSWAAGTRVRVRLLD